MKKFLLKVFNVVNSVATVIAILSALALDEISWMPCIVLAGCLGYYLLWIKIESFIKG